MAIHAYRYQNYSLQQYQLDVQQILDHDIQELFNKIQTIESALEQYDVDVILSLKISQQLYSSLDSLYNRLKIVVFPYLEKCIISGNPARSSSFEPFLNKSFNKMQMQIEALHALLKSFYFKSDYPLEIKGILDIILELEIEVMSLFKRLEDEIFRHFYSVSIINF